MPLITDILQNYSPVPDLSNVQIPTKAEETSTLVIRFNRIAGKPLYRTIRHYRLPYKTAGQQTVVPDILTSILDHNIQICHSPTRYAKPSLTLLATAEKLAK